MSTRTSTTTRSPTLADWRTWRPPGKAGVFDFYEHVYRLEDEPAYAPQRRPPSRGAASRSGATYRMSDHLPMWVEFGIDDGDAYLDGLLA